MPAGASRATARASPRRDERQPVRTPLVAGVEAHRALRALARATDRGTLLHLVVPKCSTRSLDVGGAGHDWATRWRVGFRFGEPTDQLGARTDTELAVRPSEVEFDRLRAEEERRADLAVRLPFRDLQRDLELLRRQLVGDTGRAPWKGLIVVAAVHRGRGYTFQFVSPKENSHADFFSFWTNDLTQTTLGFSCDDAEGTFLTFYLEDGALEPTRSRRSTRAAWATSCGSPSSAGGACRTT